LTKAAAPERLLAALRQLLSGKRYVTAKLAEMLADELAESQQHPRHTALSDREYQIFLLLTSGKAPPEIAQELSLNIKTVYTYRERILEKMGMKDNAALASYAFEQGLLQDRRRYGGWK
jgi:two-component system invasion response regulator UvrY